MEEKLLYKKKVDLSLFKYGLTIPQRLHREFLNGPIKHIPRGHSITGYLVYNGTEYPIRIGNADAIGRKNDTLRILYQGPELRQLMKALFPESYNFLCDPVSGELRKRKIPDDKTEYLYIFSTAKPYHYRITKVAAPDQKQVIAKNPKWHRDELILALDLYFKIDLNKSSPEHPNVIELSELLNKLPIHSNRPNQEKFCNPNGVHMKLMNFRAIDPNYPGKGLQRGGKLETEIWDEFATDRKLLSRVAQQIRNTVAGEIAQSVANSSEDEEELEFPEGKILYRIHKARERNQTLVRKAKEIALRQNNGRLKCEVCGFDFREAYGEIGEGYIECHHIIPVSELDLGAKTKLTDLALVCSNCHRMLHRKRPWITIEQLKHLYKNNR